MIRVSLFVTSLLSEDYYNRSIKRDVGNCSMHERRQKCIQDFSGNTRNLNERITLNTQEEMGE